MFDTISDFVPENVFDWDLVTVLNLKRKTALEFLYNYLNTKCHINYNSYFVIAFVRPYTLLKYVLEKTF